MKKKVLISLNEDELLAIDWYAYKKHLNRSEAIERLIYLKALNLREDPKYDRMWEIVTGDHI